MSILKLEDLPALKLLRSLYLQVPQEPAGKQEYPKLNVEHLTSMYLFPMYFPCISHVFPKFPRYFSGSLFLQVFPGYSKTFGLGPTNWADTFWGIWGIFSQIISTNQHPYWHSESLVPCFHYSTIISTKH